MATATPPMHTQSMQCDPALLATAVVAQLALGQPHRLPAPSPARILDRGAFATVYLLHTTLSAAPTSVVIRVSTRPVYNPTARSEEKDKIRGYVAIVQLIHARAPRSVRRLTPRILAYDASESCPFGHGWIAMMRLPGRPLAEAWPELSATQRAAVVGQLATFTRELSATHISETDGGEWDNVGSLVVEQDRHTFPIEEEPLELEQVPLLLPKRHGANNLRPVTQKPQLQIETQQPKSLLLLDSPDEDDDYLSCFEVLLPMPSPPPSAASSPRRAQFFSNEEDQVTTTSAVVQSCEDWLAGLECVDERKLVMPEIVIIEAESSEEEEEEDNASSSSSVNGSANDNVVYASLALWDTDGSSSPDETPYSTPMSSILQLDEEECSGDEDVSFAALTLTKTRPPLLTLSTSNLSKPTITAKSSITLKKPPATASLPQTTHALLHAALAHERTFLTEHQPAAVRCFNNNMVRLTQSGMADEVPRGARIGVARWAGYACQLEAIERVVADVAANPPDERDKLVVAHLDLQAENVLVFMEEDEEDEAETEVQVTGVVDWEFSGVVPRWMARALPAFVRDSDEEDSDREDEDDCNEQEEGVLPVWEDATSRWRMPKPTAANKNENPLECVWRAGTDIGQDHQEEDAKWEREETLRAAWTVANIEWHEVQRACAWARGWLATHKAAPEPSSQLASKGTQYLSVDPPSLSDVESSPSKRSDRSYVVSESGTGDSAETAESAMPMTPTEDDQEVLPIPPGVGKMLKATNGALVLTGMFVRPGEEDESDEGSDSDEEVGEREGSESEESENEDGEDEDEDSTGHDWRDEFECAFGFGAPNTTVTTLTKSRATPSLTTSAPSDRHRHQQHQKSKARAEKQAAVRKLWERGMNNPAPIAGYEVLWEEPPVFSQDDLEFVVERDLDAGW